MKFIYIILFVSMGLFVNELINCVNEECNAFYFSLCVIMLLGAMLAVGKAEYEEQLLNNQGS